MKTKIDWWNIIIVFGIFSLLVFGTMVFMNLRTEEAKCLADPIPFGAKAFAKSQGQDVTVTITAPNKETLYYQTDLYDIENDINSFRLK